MSIWARPGFRRLWGASVFSAAGTQVAELAVPATAILVVGASAQELSWVRVAQFAPFLLLTLWLGAVVDRGRQRRLMVAADSVRAVLFLVLGLLALQDLLGLEVLIVVAAAAGCCAVLHQLAAFNLTPAVVGAELLPEANAKIIATEQAIEVGGAGAGGALVQGLGAAIALFANGAAFLASALCLSRLSVPGAPSSEAPDRLARAREGLVGLFRHRYVRPLAAEAATWNLGWEVFALAVTYQFLVPTGPGPLVLGLVLACGGLGGVLGSVASGRLTARFGYGRSLVSTMLVGNTAPVTGVLVARAFDTPVAWTYALALLVSGFGIGIANSQAVTVRQLVVEPALRGRLNAAYRLVGALAVAVGAIAGGFLIAALGAQHAIELGGAVMAAAALVVALSPVRRLTSTTAETASGHRQQS